MSEPTAKIGDLGSAPIIPMILIAIGGYLTWFGVHYWRRDITWPSDPVKSVLQGKGVPEQGTISQTSADILTSAQDDSGGTSSPPASGTAGSTGGKPQNTARMLLGTYGWPASEMIPLTELWTQESGWQPSAWNASGAYGIAQALGHAGAGECATGPRSVGSDTPGQNCAYGSQYGLTPAQARAANSGNGYYQIMWGLGYIRAEYGSPSKAWAHEIAFNSY